VLFGFDLWLADSNLTMAYITDHEILSHLSCIGYTLNHILPVCVSLNRVLIKMLVCDGHLACKSCFSYPERFCYVTFKATSSINS